MQHSSDIKARTSFVTVPTNRQS